MKRLVMWSAVMAAVYAHAVTSPLGTDPENYVFAPFDDAIESSDRGGTNGVKVLLQGYVMGPNASYRVIRAEDIAYMAEAIAERAAYLNGWNVPRTYTNRQGQIRKTMYDGSNTGLQLISNGEPRGPDLSVNPGSSFSTASDRALPTGYFASNPFQGGLTHHFIRYGSSLDLDYYKKVHWYYYTNTYEIVTTNVYYPTYETNTKRDDWPKIQNDKGGTYESSTSKRSPAMLASLERSFWPTHSLAERVCSGIPVNSYLKAVVQALWPEEALEPVNWDDGDAFVPGYDSEQWWTIGFRSNPRPDWQMVRGLYRAFAACKYLVNAVGHDSYTNVIVTSESPATDVQSVRWNSDKQRYETYDNSQPARDPTVYTNQQVGAMFFGSATRSLGKHGEQWLESYSASYSLKTTAGGKKLLSFPFSGWLLKPRANKQAVIDRTVDVMLIGEFNISDQTYIYYRASANTEDPPPTGVVTNMYFAYRTTARIGRKGDDSATDLTDATDLVLYIDMDDLNLSGSSGLAARLCEAAGAPFINSGWDHSEAPSPAQQYRTLRSYYWNISFLDSAHRMVTTPKFGTDIPYQEGGVD